MASLLSNHVNNLAEGMDKIKCKYGLGNKKNEACRIKYKDCECFFEYTHFKDDLIEYKCLCCKKNYQKKFDGNLKSDFLIHTNFLDMITISLIYCCEKVFTHMNIWMIGKNSTKLHYLKKKIFTVI